MRSKLYNQEGKEAGTIDVPESVFNVPMNNDLLHQVVVSMRANARLGTAHAKDRGDVRGGGKKPWRQKGTGRARHGSRRSPLWIGGGVTFGPLNERDYRKKINKKVRAKALAVALSEKLRQGELIFIDTLSFNEAKAKFAKEALARLSEIPHAETLATKKRNALLISLPERDEVLEQAFQNFGNVEIMYAKDINPVSVLTYKYVIVVRPDAALPLLEKRVTGNKE